MGVEGALHLDILEGDLSQQRVSGDGEARSQIVKRKGEANVRLHHPTLHLTPGFVSLCEGRFTHRGPS